MDSPYSEMMPTNQVPHAGYIPGAEGGRSDTKPMSVKRGAYILPADTLSAVGDGNSIAGAAKMSKMFNMDAAPYGAGKPRIKGTPLRVKGVSRTARPIRQRFDDGGMIDDGDAEILASDGEMVIPP